MKFQDRKYQLDCVNAWYKELLNGINPLVAVPTGAGKTVILCKLIDKWIEDNPNSNVLVLSHTKEIVRQDYEAMIEFFPEFGLGIYRNVICTCRWKTRCIG